MDLRQFRYFMSIVEHGSMTKAAQALHVAQPALSQQIASLEQELGGSLFERSAQGMKATSSGEVLYQQARSILRQIEEIRTVVGREINSPSGHVSIGVPGSTAKVFAVSLMKALDAHPGIIIELVERPSAELVTLIAKGAVDMAIATDAQACNGVAITPLFREQLYAVLPVSSSRAAASWHDTATISLKDLAREKMLLSSRPNSIRNRLEAAFIDAGLSYKLVGEVNSTDLMVRLVSSGIGCTVLPWNAVAAEVTNKTLYACAIADVTLSRELSLCLPRAHSLSPAVSLVRDLLIADLKRSALQPWWRGVTSVDGAVQR